MPWKWPHSPMLLCLLQAANRIVCHCVISSRLALFDEPGLLSLWLGCKWSYHTPLPPNAAALTCWLPGPGSTVGAHVSPNTTPQSSSRFPFPNTLTQQISTPLSHIWSCSFICVLVGRESGVWMDGWIWVYGGFVLLGCQAAGGVPIIFPQQPLHLLYGRELGK